MVGSDRDRNFFVDDLAANETDSTKGRVREALRKPALAGVIYLGTSAVFVLRTGDQWKANPKERFGRASAVHTRFLEWASAGVFPGTSANAAPDSSGSAASMQAADQAASSRAWWRKWSSTTLAMKW